MAPKVTTESVQAMCAAYGDIDSSVVSRAISILGTVNKLCDGVRGSHAGDLEAHADALVLDDAHLDETRFFLLRLALQVYADYCSEAAPAGRTFCDLTGSMGRASLAASPPPGSDADVTS